MQTVFQAQISGGSASDKIKNTVLNALEFFIVGISGGTLAQRQQVAEALLESIKLNVSLRVGDTSLTYVGTDVPLNFFRRQMNQDGGYASPLTGLAVELGYVPVTEDAEMFISCDWDPSAGENGAVSTGQAKLICDPKRVPGYEFEGMSKIYRTSDQEQGSYTHSREVTALAAAYLIGEGADDLESVQKTFPDGTTSKEAGRNVRLDSAANTSHENEEAGPLLRVHNAHGEAIVDEVPSLKIVAPTGTKLVQVGLIPAGSVEEA